MVAPVDSETVVVTTVTRSLKAESPLYLPKADALGAANPAAASTDPGSLAPEPGLLNLSEEALGGAPVDLRVRPRFDEAEHIRE